MRERRRRGTVTSHWFLCFFPSVLQQPLILIHEFIEWPFAGDPFLSRQLHYGHQMPPATCHTSHSFQLHLTELWTVCFHYYYLSNVFTRMRTSDGVCSFFFSVWLRTFSKLIHIFGGSVLLRTVSKCTRHSCTRRHTARKLRISV